MSENKQICDLDLEQFVLGELSENEKEQIREKTATDSGLAQALNEIEIANNDFLKRFPASRVVPEIAFRSGRQYPNAARTTAQSLFSLKRRLLILSPVLAAAICLLVFLQPWRKMNTEIAPYDMAPDSIIVKGSSPVNLNRTQLLVYRLHDQRVELLKDRQAVKIGDLLQLAYVSAEESYGMIFSIDGRGGVSLHFPKHELGSTVLECHKKIPLPEAIELDDAPNFERFVFLTSALPIDVARVMKAAREFSRDSQNASHAAIKLPQGINQYSIVIKKRKTP